MAFDDDTLGQYVNKEEPVTLDRVVRWKEQRPTAEQLQLLLEDFFNGAAELRWDQDRWFCALPGKPCEPFKRLRDDVVTRDSQMGMDITRWIEVWLSDESVYVMTRHADRFTNALAEELANLLAWGWKGEREPM